jgi:hypothetical protein
MQRRIVSVGSGEEVAHGKERADIEASWLKSLETIIEAQHIEGSEERGGFGAHATPRQEEALVGRDRSTIEKPARIPGKPFNTAVASYPQTVRGPGNKNGIAFTTGRYGFSFGVCFIRRPNRARTADLRGATDSTTVRAR